MQKTFLPLLKLTKYEVHIWQITFDRYMGLIDEFMKILSDNEQIRARSFKFDKDRKPYVISRGMIRMILSGYLGVLPGEINFSYGIYGKPSLSNTVFHIPLCFNLSHSNNIALLAVSQAREVGVDVEYIRSVSQMEQIVRCFFSKREYEVIYSLPPSQKEQMFFDLWTCKEAFIKAIGKGFSYPLNQFEVSLTEEEFIIQVQNENSYQSNKRWVLQKLDVPAGYTAAICVEGNNFELYYKEWTE